MNTEELSADCGLQMIDLAEQKTAVPQIYVSMTLQHDSKHNILAEKNFRALKKTNKTKLHFEDPCGQPLESHSDSFTSHGDRWGTA